jgi:hypothetical protein
MLIIPYLFSPMGNPITMGAAVLRPAPQQKWRRLLRAICAGRHAWQCAASNFTDIKNITPTDHSVDAEVADLEYDIALACLLMLL